MASNLARYCAHNPDPITAGRGCLNSGLAEDGVVFVNVEPHIGQYCFIGRTSLVEACAEMFGLSPNKVKGLLMGTDKPSVALKAAEERIAELEPVAEKYETLVSAINDLQTHGD